jgi:hypothetical protein
MGRTGLLGVPPVQLTPAAVVWLFQFAKLTKKRVDAYVPVPATGKLPPGVCDDDWTRFVELVAAVGTAVSV